MSIPTDTRARHSADPPPQRRSRRQALPRRQAQPRRRTGRTRQSNPSARRYLSLRLRRLGALGLLALALVLLVRALVPPPPATVPVLVATRDLTAGTPLAQADVTVRESTANDAPPGALAEPGDAIGLPPAVALPAGTPLTSTVLVGPSFTDDAPEGTLALALALPSPGQAQLAQPGRTVQLLVTPPGGERAELAGSALVLATVVGEAANAGASVLPTAAGTAVPTIYVAVAPSVAMVLAGADASGTLTVAGG